MPMSFEPGAPPEEGFIPLCIPEIRGNEWKYIEECLNTGWVSSVGSFVDRFEQELATYVGARYAVAATSGTAALHIALLVAGIQPEDEVLVSTLTFIAPANAIRYVGAWPVFIDAEPDYWQMDIQKVVDFLEQGCRWRGGHLYNKATGRRVKAIMPVHVLGHPVDMDPLLTMARQYNLTVIEDATESLGTRYKKQMVGCLGDMTCFSFNGNKIITTGGGGMVVTNNEQWATQAKYLTTQAKDDPLEYIHHEIGYNYRLTNIQAAMGCAQLEQLPDYIEAKRRIAARYAEVLADIPGLTLMRQAEWAYSIFWMYTVLVDETTFGMAARALLRHLADHNIQTRLLWQPLHLSAAHTSAAHTNVGGMTCPVAEGLNRDALSLPCSVGLTSCAQDYVIKILTATGRVE